MDERTRYLVTECKRQEESCLYTSTTLFEWIKWLRLWRVVFVVVPIVLGGVATWPLLAKLPDREWVTGLCALLAGLAPAVYKALQWDVSLEAVGKSANAFKTLQDRFRQGSQIAALGDFGEFKSTLDALMERMDATRDGSLTAPERFFKKARVKINAGHYDFAVDQAKPG